jgi:iron complex transport system substrate-binding protein
LVIGHWLVILVWSFVIPGGCDRPPAPVTGKSPRIASLVPAATDLIVGMGAGEHLVAVSNQEVDRAEIRQLPRVGDYQTIDWEKLAQLRPDVMIVFMSADRIPPGVQQRADQLHIRLVNIKTERLADILKTIDFLGELTGESAKATELAANLRGKLDAVAKRVVGMEKIPTLIIRDEDGFPLIAGDTFVDDLLTIAGGKNVAGGFNMRYPSVDRERVMELAPRAVIQLMPAAPPQVVVRAKGIWQQLPDLPAVKDGRVYVLTDWYVLQPGSHVGDLAEQFAEKLHPKSP